MRLKLSFALLTLSLALGGGSANAGPPAAHSKECMSVGFWKQQVNLHSSGVHVMVLADVRGFEARDLVAKVNETPPETNMKADRIVVLGARAVETDAPAPYLLVAFFNRGCLVTSGRADPAAIAQLFSGVSI
jgi:hypothetical protein